MAQLSSVIGSILRDIIAAQHEANLYSLALSESYGKDGKVKDFQLPNVMVSDMELELKYGVKNTTDNQQQFNIRYSQFREFLKEVCDETAKVVIRNVTATVLGTNIPGKEEDKHFFERLKQENTLQNAFKTFLVRNMRNAFRSNLYEAVDTATGAPKAEVLVNKITDVVRSKLLYDSRLDELFSGKEGEALRNLAEENMVAAITGLIEKLVKNTTFKKLKSFPKLDVAITAEELMNMPEEAIHSFKFKFSPRNYSITNLDEEIANEEFIMK